MLKIKLFFSRYRGLRWWILGLIIGAHFLNYTDRHAMSLLAPLLGQVVGWSELEYGRIVIAFQISYAIFVLLGGLLIDRIGTRLGVGLSLIAWSIAQLLHVLPQSAVGFGAARFGLAAGEAVGFTGLLKAMNEWFSDRERGFAAGLVLSTIQFASIIAPLFIPFAAAAYGWQSVFVVTGISGLLLAIPWFMIYRRPAQHAMLTEHELLIIEEGRPSEENTQAPGVLALLKTPQLWAYTAAAALTQPAWSFITYWFPKFLYRVHHVSGTAATKYLVAAAVMSAFGALGGGLGSSFLIKRGVAAATARKRIMLTTAIIMPVVALAANVESTWAATILVGVAAAGFHCWAANNMALIGDMMPTRAIGSSVGFSYFMASIAATISAEVTGRILSHSANNYLPMFAYTGMIFLIAIAIVYALTHNRGRANFS